jgi:hypothetical protein
MLRIRTSGTAGYVRVHVYTYVPRIGQQETRFKKMVQCHRVAIDARGGPIGLEILGCASEAVLGRVAS